MRLQLDRQLLSEIGLGHLPPAAQDRILSRFADTLQTLVGIQLANRMYSRDLDTFVEVAERDQVQGLARIKESVPEYQAVVAEQFEYVVSRLKARLEASEGGDPA